jgi:hypothetical protein
MVNYLETGILLHDDNQLTEFHDRHSPSWCVGKLKSNVVGFLSYQQHTIDLWSKIEL